MLTSNIRTTYRNNPCVRFAQGDIFRDLEFIVINGDGSQLQIKIPYAVILTQDCDLEQGYKFTDVIEETDGSKKFNQYLPNILFVPAFQAEILRQGNHLKDIYNISTEKISTDPFKKLKNNEISRYHYLSPYAEGQVPELIIDFKAYYTLTFDYFIGIFREHYLISLNELFRENFSQRFAHYLNRVGLPEL